MFVDRKIKSKAQFDVLVGKIKRLEGARDEVANVATPLVQAMFLNDSGPSALDATEIFDKLRVAPDVYFKNIKKAGSMGASMVLAMTKSLYRESKSTPLMDLQTGQAKRLLLILSAMLKMRLTKLQVML